MGSDRWQYLIIAASAAGRFDYRDADSYDGLWLKREELILNQYEAERLIDLVSAQHMQHAASTVWPAFDKEGGMYKMHHKESSASLRKLGTLLLPYVKVDGKSAYKGEIDQLKDEWSKQFGVEIGSEEMKQLERQVKDQRKRRDLVAKQRRDQSARKLQDMQKKQREVRAARNRNNIRQQTNNRRRKK